MSDVANEPLRVVPLGGLGEVGLNTMVLEHAGERLMIDCGLMFPRADAPGAEIVIPDFSWVKAQGEALTGIVLTHAHEDHLGALSYLLREVPVPVYGTPFTLALARHRLDEAGVRADLRAFGPGERFGVGERFTVEPVRVTHSVPDAVGLVVKTAAATLVHTGDFKLDGMPIDGHQTDLARLAALGEEGVDVLLSDSTNSEVVGTTGSESLVKATFERLFSAAAGRIVVALFGSHLHRVKHTLDLAARLGRKVIVAGRSLQRNLELAEQAQLFTVPKDLVVPLEAAPALAPHRVLVLCTGAQGEPRSALTGFLSPEPGHFRVGPGDLVVLSSRTIPGNEMVVSDLVNRLIAKGARVVTGAIEPGVHVSGHAAKEEQRRMLQAVRPKSFVPIHGELRHLTTHLSLAKDVGVADAGLFLLTDGDVAGFTKAGGTTLGRVANGRHFMRRDGLAPIGDAALSERRQLAEAGVAVAVVVVQQGGGKLLLGPTLYARGLEEAEVAALPLAAEGARLALTELSEAVRGDDERVREAVVAGARRVFKQLLGTRPGILPVVVRL